MGGLGKLIEKELKKAFYNIAKALGIIKVYYTVKNWFLNIINNIVNFFKMVFFYIQCAIKMLSNFSKCIGYYLVDMLKFFGVYIWIYLLMSLMGLGKEWSNVQYSIDRLIGWPNSVKNQCYRCKDKVDDEDRFEELKRYFRRNKTKSRFNFFAFIMIILTIFLLFYTFWFHILRKKQTSAPTI